MIKTRIYTSLHYLSSVTAGGGGKKDEVERFYNKTSHACENLLLLLCKETFREFAAARLSAFLSLFSLFDPFFPLIRMRPDIRCSSGM